MKKILSHYKLVFILIAGLIFSLSVSWQMTHSQTKPLTLAQILVGLQSKSSGLSLAKKNEVIRKDVLRVGVTFRLTRDNEQSLREAGANNALINAIRLRGPRPPRTPTPTTTPISSTKKPSAKFRTMSFEPNVTKGGVRGMNIKTDLSIYNLKGVDVQITVTFQDSAGRTLRSSNPKYSNKRGDLALFQTLKPGYDSTIYKDRKLFVPYSEIRLPVGVNKVRAHADLIYPTGTSIQHLTYYDFSFVKPRPSLLKPTSKFEKMWVDYNKTQGEEMGMIVHVRFRVNNIKGYRAQVAIRFSKQSGEKLRTKNTAYSTSQGQVAIYKNVTPVSNSAYYRDVQLFIPYKEFNLPVGRFNLKMEAALIYPDGTLIGKLTDYGFRYTRSR